MKTFKYFMFLAIMAFAIMSCLDEDGDKDKVEQVTLFIASETGTYSSWAISDSEGMLYRENNKTEWKCDRFSLIEGFTYERGYEYELLVEKTTLTNPPEDDSNVHYKLINIVSKVKVVD